MNDRIEEGHGERHRNVWDRAYLLGLRDALARLDTDGEGGDDRAMPKVDEAHAIQQFNLADFQATFDRWKAEVEQRENGTLVIVHEEPIMASGTTMGMFIYWRIQPRPHIARSRR